MSNGGLQEIQGDWVAVINALTANNTPTVLYFSDKGYKNSAGIYYQARMRQPARINVTANDGGLLDVMGGASTGEIILENVDGGLNYLLDYSVDGRECTLQLISPQGVVTTWFKGIVTRLFQQDSEVIMTIKSLSESLELPLAMSRYLGTGGVEGLATDIRGNVKPRVYGAVTNATPVLCFATSGVYQVSDLSTCVINDVFDKGVAITLGSTRASLATLLATTPTAGTYDRFEGYFRLGTMTVQQITCNATDSATLAGDVFKKICDSITFSTPQKIIGQQPVITDGTTRKYSLSASATCVITSVYDEGTELENGGYYASLAEYNSTAPAAGKWRSWQGLIRVSPFIDTEYPYGELAIGTITADATDLGVTLTSTYTVSTSPTSVTALNAVGAVGLFVSQDTNINELLNQICLSCGAFWWFGDSSADNTTYNVNQICTALYTEPSTTADITLNDYRVIGDSLVRAATGVGENGVPIYSVLAKYAPNQTVQTDVLGATAQAWKARVLLPSLIQESADLTVKQRHPQANRLAFDSVLNNQVNQQAVTDRLLAYFKKRCDIIELEYFFSTLPRLTLGMTVKLIYPRVGYAGGVNMRLIGYEIDVQQNSVRMKMMGYKI
jgi:hypothetical protein